MNCSSKAKDHQMRHKKPKTSIPENKAKLHLKLSAQSQTLRQYCKIESYLHQGLFPNPLWSRDYAQLELKCS